MPSRDKLAAARQLAELLDVPWSATGIGPFAPVYVNDSLTLDFDQWDGPIPAIHFAFRVSEDAFDAILARIQGGGLSLHAIRRCSAARRTASAANTPPMT